MEYEKFMQLSEYVLPTCLKYALSRYKLYDLIHFQSYENDTIVEYLCIECGDMCSEKAYNPDEDKWYHHIVTGTDLTEEQIHRAKVHFNVLLMDCDFRINTGYEFKFKKSF